MMIKTSLIATFMMFFATSVQASCQWDGFVFPENWEIKLDRHVHVREADTRITLYSANTAEISPTPAPSEEYIKFHNHAEVEAFVKETVEEGLNRVARLSPCLLNDRLQRFGSTPVTFTSEIDSEEVGYQFPRKGNFLGMGKKEAKIFLGGSHPSANIADFKHHILHGVFHHLQINNDHFSTHQERDAFVNDNFVFQNFRGFVEVLKEDTAHACLQVAYPNMMFKELQGAEFMDACMTCINSYNHNGFLRDNVVIGGEMDEHRQKCEDLRPEYLDRNNFHPTEESSRLMNISEVEEMRRDSKARRESMDRRFQEMRQRSDARARNN